MEKNFKLVAHIKIIMGPIEYYYPPDIERLFYQESCKNTPIFVRFFMLYASFNSRISRDSGKIRDSDMIRWVKKRSSEYRDRFNHLIENDREFRDYVRKLSHIRVRNIREEKRKQLALNAGRQHKPWGKLYHIMENERDFDTLIDIIYQVRCNLFHGGKNINLRLERHLIDLCYNILNSLYEPFIGEL